MKRLLSILAAASLAAPLTATTLESEREAAFEAFSAKPEVSFAVPAIEAVEAAEPMIQPSVITPLSNPSRRGRSLGSFAMAERLDSHRDLFHLTFGNRDWDVSLAGDAAFKTAYLRLERPGDLRLYKIENLDQLRNSGIEVRIDERTVYNFRAAINIFNPVRGSTLHGTPIQGTTGPRHQILTGTILERIAAKSFAFNTGGAAYWLLYGTDINTETNRPADTRSFAVIRENGLNSKIWTLAETALPAGSSTTVQLGDASVVFSRSQDGRVEIFENAARSTVDGAIALR